MKSIIFVALALVVVAAAAPAEVEPPKILRYDNEQQPDGAYSVYVETEDGIIRIEKGELKQALDEENKPHQVLAVSGSYSYPKLDGTFEKIEYYADESGYHADGPSVPKQ